MKRMSPEEKKKLYKEIDKKTRVVSHPTTVHETIDSWVNGFPRKMYDEWRADCYKFYNDIFWAKMWSDHQKAQAYDNLINSSVQKAEAVEDNENENISLIGDGGIEDE